MRSTDLTSLVWKTKNPSVETNLDCLFLLGSSAAKMCTVPWSLDTQMRDASWLKLMLKKMAQMEIMTTSFMNLVVYQLPLTYAAVVSVGCRTTLVHSE